MAWNQNVQPLVHTSRWHRNHGRHARRWWAVGGVGGAVCGNWRKTVGRRPAAEGWESSGECPAPREALQRMGYCRTVQVWCRFCPHGKVVWGVNAAPRKTGTRCSKGKVWWGWGCNVVRVGERPPNVVTTLYRFKLGGNICLTNVASTA